MTVFTHTERTYLYIYKPSIYLKGITILKWILKWLNGKAWTGFIWLKVGTNDGLL